MAGVSQATVSRVLHSSDLVAAPTRDRVIAVLRDTGYKPNLAARAMRTHRTGTIGVVLASVTNPFYPELLQALSAALWKRDLRMIVWDTEGPGEDAAIDAIEQRLVDGLIFTTAVARTAPLLRALDRKAPLVLVNRTVAGMTCDQVDSSNREASRAFAHYVAAHGHRRVGVITANTEASTARDRSEGFLEGAAECGLRIEPNRVVKGHFSHSGGFEALQSMLASRRPPTAVFCVNDLSALGALDYARTRKVEVPGELWVIGFDDIDMASWSAYGLTTARQPLAEMADAAIELLQERIDSPGAPVTHRRFSAEARIRESTAFASFDDARPRTKARGADRRRSPGASVSASGSDSVTPSLHRTSSH
jgi:LacI family transcriptional regulator